jgi:processive 1,2-diacylglycerol beta-glucosyltransferase
MRDDPDFTLMPEEWTWAFPPDAGCGHHEPGTGRPDLEEANMSVATDSRRALVLSGSIGRGHDSVAEACLHALASVGFSGDVLDCMALLGGVGNAIGDAVFRWMLSVPPLYDAFHFSQMRAGTRLAERAEQAAADRLVPRLRQELHAQPADLLLSVFATGAGALGRLRQEDLHTPTVVVCTDATAHRLWAHPGVDRYVVCSAMAAGTVRQYLPEADVVLIPPPVRAPFFDPPDRDSARRQHDVDPDVPCVLLMAGGWGLAPLQGAAEALAESGSRVFAVAGANATLQRRLAMSAAQLRPVGGGPGITALGFTDQIPSLMAAADVVVTSPGQSCHEARVVGRPLVVLDVVPGHGRENLLLELEHGGALACPPNPQAVVVATAAARGGIEPASRPWPVDNPRQWDLRFLSVLKDLIPVDATSTIERDGEADAERPAS